MGISGVGNERPTWVVELGHTDAGAPPASASAAPSSTFAHAVTGLTRAVDRGEALIANAGHLGNYDAATLIALQAGIYRYSEAVELVAKIVDHASSAARTVLQGSH
ncbi:MAG TPA: hypothetical protein VGI10_06050 [Polyangiaceae bacterium]|jgi:hypothetical protein